MDSRAPQRRERWPRRWAALAALVVSLATAACGGSSSPATASGTWTVAHPEPSTNLPGYSSIYGVSCTSSSFCQAVDESGNAIGWNGATWSKPRPVTPGNTLDSVSCASPTFCMTLADQRAVVFNGTAWTISSAAGLAPSSPTGGEYRVSCTSPTFCASVNTAGVVTTFNGTTWGHETHVDDGTATKPVQDITCVSPTFCVVVSADGDIAMLTGATWTRNSSPGQSVLHSVSCPTTTFCMALDLTGHALVFDGSMWTMAQSMPGVGSLTYSVSCATASHCAVARSDGSVSVWQSGSWSRPQPVLHDGTQAAARISCPTTTFCALVDSSGSAATYKG
ncbi:MAG TPA: hypothetical protein VIH95_09550 [Acidimicrobiales bacterium]